MEELSDQQNPRIVDFQNDQAFQDGKQCQNKEVASTPRSNAGLPDDLGPKMKLRIGL